MFQITKLKDVTVVHLTGVMNPHRVEALEQMLSDFLGDEVEKLVLNFAAVETLSDQSIQSLRFRMLENKKFRAKVKFASLQNESLEKEILEFENYQSVQEAVMSFGRRRRTDRVWH